MGEKTVFHFIREWAEARGLYCNGNIGKQYEKLLEEVGELGRSLIHDDQPEVEDAIGDIVIVLTNLAHKRGVSIEKCIDGAYQIIKNRTGKMINGTFVKDK